MIKDELIDISEVTPTQKIETTRDDIVTNSSNQINPVNNRYQNRYLFSSTGTGKGP